MNYEYEVILLELVVQTSFNLFFLLCDLSSLLLLFSIISVERLSTIQRN